MALSNRTVERSNELVINFASPADNTPIEMQVSNTLFRDNLKSKKLTLSYLEIDNTAVPIKVVDKLNIDPAPTGYTKLVQVAPNPIIGNISNKSVNYVWGIEEGANKNYCIPQWTPQENILPPTSLLNEKQVYKNPYFYVYDLTHFLSIMSASLSQLYIEKTATTPKVCEFVFDPVAGNITLLLSKVDIGANINMIQVNQTLRELLQFKNVPATNPYFYNLISDGERSYKSEDCLTYTSRFISRQWVSFDTVLITSDLPVNSVEYQSNQVSSSESAVSYKNVIFSLNTVESNINFYPYYSLVENTTDKYLSFTQDNFMETVYNIKVSLFNKRLNLSIPYKLKKGELFNMSLLIFKE